jgi:hypothetical protein
MYMAIYTTSQSQLHKVKTLVLVPDGSILLACNFVTEVATLRCEVRVLAQVLDPAEEEFELPVCGGGCVLRDLSN